jgi:E3 ubiquitin-protein ligase TRIP12
MCHVMDVHPSSAAAIVHYDAVPLLCEKLLSIEYIDLAEQCLQALEKLSHEHPLAILRAGGMQAVLQFVDFFATGVQRIAVSTAANLCRGLPIEWCAPALAPNPVAPYAVCSCGAILGPAAGLCEGGGPWGARHTRTQGGRDAVC